MVGPRCVSADTADKNRYIGAVSVGFGPDGKRLRRKVSGSLTELVYRRELRPVIATGAEIMDRIFSSLA